MIWLCFIGEGKGLLTGSKQTTRQRFTTWSKAWFEPRPDRLNLKSFDQRVGVENKCNSNVAARPNLKKVGRAAQNYWRASPYDTPADLNANGQKWVSPNQLMSQGYLVAEEGLEPPTRRL